MFRVMIKSSSFALILGIFLAIGIGVIPVFSTVEAFQITPAPVTATLQLPTLVPLPTRTPIRVVNSLQLTSPTPTPGSTRAPAPGDRMYTVSAGDTLWSIAVKFYGNGTKYGLILRANNLPENVTLRVGSPLLIPSLDPGSVVSLPTLAPSATPSAVSAPPQPTPPALPTNMLPQPSPTQIAQPIALASPAPGNSSPEFSSTSEESATSQTLSFLLTVINLISGACFVGALLFAFMAVDSYRHTRQFVRRRRIGNRVRIGL